MTASPSQQSDLSAMSLVTACMQQRPNIQQAAVTTKHKDKRFTQEGLIPTTFRSRRALAYNLQDSAFFKMDIFRSALQRVTCPVKLPSLRKAGPLAMACECPCLRASVLASLSSKSSSCTRSSLIGARLRANISELHRCRRGSVRCRSNLSRVLKQMPHIGHSPLASAKNLILDLVLCTTL